MSLDLKDLPSRRFLLELATQMPEVDVTAVDSALVLLRTADDVASAFDAHFGRYGISQGKFAVMMLLKRYRASGLTPSTLAERAGVTRGTMTGLLQGLERASLIQRVEHDEDRRMASIRLSSTGEELLERMLPEHYRRTAELMEHLTEEERLTFISLLAKVRRGMDALRKS